MNRILITFLILFTIQACTQGKALLEKPTIDKRVELMSVVFRLAERPEYSHKKCKPYTDKIEQYFEKYKDHELIQFTKSIIDEYGIVFDAPMWMAVHLDDDLNLLADVKDVWQLDPRWTKESVEKFVPLLQQFYKDTRFDEFFESNSGLYDEAVKRYTPIYEQVDLNWCHHFFGKEPTDSFLIRIGLNSRGNCYGVNVDYTDGSRKVYAIMGVWMTDNTGMPEFSKKLDLPILIHEFSHPFVDYLTEKNKELFQESGEKILSAIKNVIDTDAYTSWEVILDEALLNASVIKYMKDHDFDQADINSWIELIKGSFGSFWIEELANELDNYDKQRDKYPTIESYMPKLAEAYKVWTEDIPVKQVQPPTENQP